MSFKNSTFDWFSALILVVLLAPITVSAKTTIRFATVAPASSSWMEEMKALNDEVIARSGGEVAFKFYPNMIMGDEKDVIRKMRLGQIQAGGFTGFGLGEIVPDIRILELPYLFRSDEEIDFVADKVFDSYYQSFFDQGFVLLGWADVGWIYFLSNRPMASPADLTTVKPWMWLGDPLAEAFFKELNKTPVQLSVTDVMMSLQTGMIDAVYSSPLAALALQWFTQVKYISDVPFTHSTGAVLMDRKTFEKLTPPNQEMLRTVAREHLRKLTLQSRQDNQAAYQQILKEGAQKFPSTADQRQEMEAVGPKVFERLKGALFSPERFERIQALLKEYRSRPSHP